MIPEPRTTGTGATAGATDNRYWRHERQILEEPQAITKDTGAMNDRRYTGAMNDRRYRYDWRATNNKYWRLDLLSLFVSPVVSVVECGSSGGCLLLLVLGLHQYWLCRSWLRYLLLLAPASVVVVACPGVALVLCCSLVAPVSSISCRS